MKPRSGIYWNRRLFRWELWLSGRMDSWWRPISPHEVPIAERDA